jgi:hypothetical protein
MTALNVFKVTGDGDGECVRVSLSAGLPGQKAACRLTKQQSKWLCSALGSPATATPLKGRVMVYHGIFLFIMNR